MNNLTKIILRLKNKKFLTAYLLLFVVNQSVAQDISLSQFYANMVSLNPAFSGVHEGNRFNSFYRNQWTTASSGFQSYGVVFDSYFPKLRGGAGVMVSNEVLGRLNLPSFDLVYSYQMEATRDLFLSFGIQAGIVQRIRSSSDFIFEEPEQIQSGFINTYPDFAIGVVMFYKYLYGGISVDHVLKPFHSDSFRLNRKFTAHVGLLKYFDGRLIKQQRVLSPNIVIQMAGMQQNFNWGANFQYEKIIGGIWARHNFNPDFDAIIFSLGFKTYNYKISYSYDMSIGKRMNLPLSSHELSYTVIWTKKRKDGKKRIKSPTFLQ